MKNYLKILLLLPVSVLLFSGCNKDDDDPEVSPLPVITINPATAIKSDSATVSANITSEGQSAVIHRGFCWSTTPNPSVSNSHSDNAFGPGAFSHVITGLNPNTVYFVRAYATNALGTVYSEQIFFKTKYQIGGTGPGGGIIFYLNGSGGGLEAAPFSTQMSAEWGCPSLTGASDTTVGSGLSNTNLILTTCGPATSAASICASLIYNGFDDWYLPSKQELNLMYTNLHLAGLGSFSANRYWSSSEFSDTNAWRQDFSDGVQFASIKGISYLVRAVRSF